MTLKKIDDIMDDKKIFLYFIVSRKAEWVLFVKTLLLFILNIQNVIDPINSLWIGH